MSILADLPLVEHALLERGLVSADQLRIARQEQALTRQPITRLLVQLGFISEQVLRDALSEQHGQRSVELVHMQPAPDALARIPHELARRHCLLPLALDESAGLFTLALADPDDLVALDRVRAQLGHGYQLSTLLAAESDLLHAIERHYGNHSIDGILGELDPASTPPPARTPHTMDDTQPVARLVQALLAEAVEQRASDLHFEPEANCLRLRARIDGVLCQQRSLHLRYWPAMLVRLKLLSGMDIAETRAPQDGHFSLALNGRDIDVRAAVHPTTHGENLVLRILDRDKGIVPLDRLGLDSSALDMLKRIISRPEGIVLVTGPTGSGKTTTLYSMLNHVNDASVNIMTLEDPVEYPLPLIRQTSVNECVKLDFANGIRSMMRQDPDIILVGEIRDRETAEMAFRAAMTGHQVYTTLHTHSALGAVPRLLDIGILPEIMAGNISGILAQRLVRRLCPQCKHPYIPNTAERKLLGLPEHDTDPLFRAAGCEACAHQGYRGRLALMEILKPDQDLDELISHRASLRQLREHARLQGYRSLAEDGIRQIREGATSLAEVARVVDLGDRLH